MNLLLQNVRFTLRLLRKRPGITALAIATLVLGVGLNTAIFSVLNAVVLRPLPVADPDRIVNLYAKVIRTGATLGISYPEYLDWKSQARSFQEIAVIYALSFTLTGQGPPEHLKVDAISASGFRTWGVNTVLGRTFTDDEDRPESRRLAVLNHRFWLQKFGGGHAVLGKILVLDSQAYTIIGVLQATQIPLLNYPDLWVANGPQLDQRMMRRDSRYFFPYARLRPGVTSSQAQAEMDTIAARLADQYPATNKDMGVIAMSAADRLTADGRKPLSLLIVTSSLIFLLAAVNVMTVFFGNTVERGQELAVRIALGARRSSLVRQLAFQTLLFGFAGVSFGLVLVKLTLVVFLYRFPNALLRFQETTIDYQVVLAAFAMALLASLIAAALPAFYVLKLNPARELTGLWSSLAQPKHRAWGRVTLILFEVSLASGLALISGLLIKSFYQVEKVDLGFNPSQVLTFEINPPVNRYKEPVQKAALYRAAYEKLVAAPGTESASAISNPPLTDQASANYLEVDGQSPMFGQRLLVQDEAVLPGFFQTMKVPLLQGRDFSQDDREGAPQVVILDEVLAEKLWPGQNPLGKHVRLPDAQNSPTWREVVGIVQETRHFGPERKVRWMQLYSPLYQDPRASTFFVIKTALPESAVQSWAEKALAEVDKDLPLENFETMESHLDNILSGRKLTLLLLSGFAGIGILLAIIGIYGAVANSVIQRQRELAIRMALGATPSRIAFLLGHSTLLSTLAGIALGSGLVMGAARLLASLLFGVSALDPTIYILTTAFLLLLALLAAGIPATRFFRFNIQEILRR